MQRAMLDVQHVVASITLSIFTSVMIVALVWYVPPSSPIVHHSSVVISKPVLAITKKAVSGTPEHLEIPEINVDLSIEPGRFNPEDNSWTLSDTGVLFATNTVPVNNNNGTTLLYGHGTWPIFGNLPDLKIGDEARVRVASGDVFVYKYLHRRDVLPTDTRIFDIDGPPRLVLQTCSGPWDSERSLYSFEFVEVIRG